MSVIIITGLLLLGGAFVGFVIYLQLKEQARIDKLRKAATLNNQTRQVRHYIDDLPAQYQPKELRVWLFTRLIGIFDELLVLAPDEKTERRRQRVAEEFEVFKKSTQKRKAKAVNDDIMVINLRRLLDSLQTFLKSSRGAKKLDPDAFERYSQQIAFYRYKLASDNKSFLARKAFLSGKLEDSIALYKKAILELSPISTMDEAVEIENRTNKIIEEIEADLKLQEEAKQLEEEEEEGLSGEWDNFVEDDGFVKKRTF